MVERLAKELAEQGKLVEVLKRTSTRKYDSGARMYCTAFDSLPPLALSQSPSVPLSHAFVLQSSLRPLQLSLIHSETL